MVLTWAVLLVAMQAEVADAGVGPAASEAIEQLADVGVAVEPPPAAALAPAPVAPVAVAPVATAAAPLSAAARLRNALGVGYFGASVRTESTLTQLGERTVTSSTPFLGVRWWTPLALGPNGRLGLEVAGGVSIFTSETENAVGLGLESRRGPTRRGFGVHAAVPLALGGGENVIVSVAPEFRHLVAETASSAPPPLIETMPTRLPGTSTSELALRGGVEIFFGFIGVPNLSLELDARFLLRWIEARSLGINGSLALVRSFGVSSTISEDPLAMLFASVAAKYYF